jgi:hypothetical protein
MSEVKFHIKLRPREELEPAEDATPAQKKAAKKLLNQYDQIISKWAKGVHKMNNMGIPASSSGDIVIAPELIGFGIRKRRCRR